MKEERINLGGRKAVLIIVAFAVLCWGRVLGMGGLWWDDWAWVWHYFGTGGYDEFMEPFRWLRHMSVGSVFFILMRASELLGERAIYLGGFLRFLTLTANALLLYAILVRVLRNKSIIPVAVAVAYVASPVVNNFALVTYSYNLFLLFYLLSVLFSIKAVEGVRLRVPYYLVSVALAFASMASLESFIVFDVIRPVVFLYIFLGRGNSFGRALKRSVVLWLAFVLVGSAVVLDVVLRPQTGSYTGVYDSMGMSSAFFMKYLNSLKYVFLSIYSITLKTSLIRNADFVAIALALVSASFFYYSLRKTDAAQSGSGALREARVVAVFAFFAVLAGLFPYVLTREPLTYGLDSRHALLASIGTSMFFPSILVAFHLSGRIKRGAFYLLVCSGLFLGALQCNYAVGVYKYDWEQQRSIWWQMIWRAPDIKENSFMIIDMPWYESPGGGSYVLPAEMNLAYAKSRKKEEVFSHFALALYNAFRTDQAFSYRDTFDKDVVEFESYRGKIRFYPKNLIAASYRDGYLYLDDEIKGSVMGRDEDLKFLISNAAHDRIIYEDNGNEFPLRWILGAEPEHDWKYYCQKANALSGRGDHAGVISLYREAGAAGYDLRVVAPQCLPPFAESYDAVGDSESADALFSATTGKDAN